MEVWKEIKDYEGLYQVSNLGRLKILEKVISKGKRGERLFTEKIAKGTFNKTTGYLIFTLTKNKCEKGFFAHRVVAKTFLINRLNKTQVNHIDYNKLNNAVSNLEWVSSSENVCHSNLRKNTKSNYHGVTKQASNGRYVARVTGNKKRIHLGVFDLEIDAYLIIVGYNLFHNVDNKYIKLPADQKEKAIAIYNKMVNK